MEYEVVDMIEVKDNERNVKTVLDRPFRMRAQRWYGLKQHRLKRFSKSIDSEKHFNFRAYTFTPRGIADVELYAAPRGGLSEISVEKFR